MYNIKENRVSMEIGFGIRSKKHLTMRVLHVLCNVSLCILSSLGSVHHVQHTFLRLTAAALVLTTGSASLLQVL